MTRLLLRSAKDPWQPFTAQETFQRNIPGNNVGNLVFSQAVHRVLSASDVEVVSNRFVTSPAQADQINDEYDGFVIPLANAFRPSFADALQRLTKLISLLTIPVTVVGVGAQAPINRNAQRLEPIEELVTAFMREVLNRSATVGVRGEFTRDYLADLGFHDVEVIGCPSMFMWGEQLPGTRQVETVATTSAVSIGVSPYVKAMGPIVEHHLSRYRDLTYLPQDVITLGRMLDGPLPEDEGQASDRPIYLNHRLFVEDRVRFPLDPRTWMAYLATRDAYFGTRIHGTIVSLLSGTPAVLLAHDSRTLELAKYHEIPFRKIKNLPEDIDVAQLYAEADYAGLHRGHGGRLATYLAFLERNGLRHVFAPGESADGFDARLAAADLPPIVTMPPTAAASEGRVRATLRGLRHKAVRSSHKKG